MVAASAVYLALQRVIVLLFVGDGKPENRGLSLLKYCFSHNGGVVVWDDIPLVPIFPARTCPADLQHSPLPDDVGADIAFVLQNPQHRGIAPDAACAGNIKSVVPVSRFVFAGCGDTLLVQFVCDLRSICSADCKLEYLSDDGSGIRVRLHAPVPTFPVAIGTDFTLILAALHLRVLGAFGLDGHVAAVILVDKILERHIHAASVALELGGIEIVADRNEAGVIKRKNALDKMVFSPAPSEAR